MPTKSLVSLTAAAVFCSVFLFSTAPASTQGRGQPVQLPEGPGKEMVQTTCSQCHALPDPERHTAREWPTVVERMKRHMAWANVVLGPPELRTVPELRTEEIVRLLQRYARPEAAKR